MDYLNQVIVPGIKVLIYIIILGVIFFPLGRFLIRYWNQKFKFFLRYSILRQKYDELLVQECYDAIDNKFDTPQFKMHLLKLNFPKDEVFEILYVFEKIKRTMGIRDDIKIERRFIRK